MHGEGDSGIDAATRALDAREREILAFLLTVEVDGVKELRVQADHVVARPWTCGCASIDLIVDHKEAPRSSISARPAIKAATIEHEDPETMFALLLWVDDGY